MSTAEQATAFRLLDERISKYTIEYNGANVDGCFDEIDAGCFGGSGRHVAARTVSIVPLKHVLDA